jgi:hypothetical protein
MNLEILPRVPGFPPSTQISPLFSRLRPTIHDNNVVLPQPEAPKSPYLRDRERITLKLLKCQTQNRSHHHKH